MANKHNALYRQRKFRSGFEYIDAASYRNDAGAVWLAYITA